MLKVQVSVESLSQEGPLCAPDVDVLSVAAAQELSETLLAVGVPYSDMFDQVAAVHGKEVARSAFIARLEGLHGGKAFQALCDIGNGHANLACDTLCAILSDPGKRGLVLNELGDLAAAGEGWILRLSDGFEAPGAVDLSDNVSIAALPDGFSTGGFCNLTDCKDLAHLPDGLRIGGDLCLVGCDNLGYLPGGLVVGGNLDLNDNTGWDGTIPLDAKIAGRIITDNHPKGIPLADWRRMHPGGEISYGD